MPSRANHQNRGQRARGFHGSRHGRPLQPPRQDPRHGRRGHVPDRPGRGAADGVVPLLHQPALPDRRREFARDHRSPCSGCPRWGLRNPIGLETGAEHKIPFAEAFWVSRWGLGGLWGREVWFSDCDC